MFFFRHNISVFGAKRRPASISAILFLVCIDGKKKADKKPKLKEVTKLGKGGWSITQSSYIEPKGCTHRASIRKSPSQKVLQGEKDRLTRQHDNSMAIIYLSGIEVLDQIEYSACKQCRLVDTGLMIDRCAALKMFSPNFLQPIPR